MPEAKTILVVDDSAAVRRQLREPLEADGFAVIEAENGARALQVAAETGLSLMIVDVNMPIMGGLEMIEKVRELPDHKRTPIFVLTTESGADAARRGKSVGAMAWIVKPVKPDVLIKGIRTVLGSRAAP
jgi:two-component system, chemotaxis family, chemotaxis protein CheY